MDASKLYGVITERDGYGIELDGTHTLKSHGWCESQRKDVWILMLPPQKG